MEENNVAFQTQLARGIEVQVRKDGRIRGDQAWLFDFDDPDNNDWLVVNQFTVINGKYNRRPDVVVFVNGMPIAVIELKNPEDENATIKSAWNQLQTYKSEIPALFDHNEILVISDGTEAKVGSLTAGFERFGPWRTIDGDDVAPDATPKLEVLLKGLFEKQRLLDYIRHFILWETDDGFIKKIAGYHQYHAANKAIAETVRASVSRGRQADRRRLAHAGLRQVHLDGVLHGKLILQPDELDGLPDHHWTMHTEFATGGIPGFVHLYAGEEASATGVCMQLGDEDYIASTHRGHGHCIAKGVDPVEMMAEIYGKVTGSCKGKGGSMHIADLSKGMMGANGIVGGGGPLICGAALAAKTSKKGGVGICFFGDGASNQGTIFEAMNLAAVWNLPAIFVAENNGYAESTASAWSVACDNIADRASAFGMPGVIVDGFDFFAVYEAAAEAVRRARDGGGPTLIEAKFMRYFGHFEGDAQTYRGADEVREAAPGKRLPAALPPAGHVVRRGPGSRARRDRQGRRSR